MENQKQQTEREWSDSGPTTRSKARVLAEKADKDITSAEGGYSGTLPNSMMIHPLMFSNSYGHIHHDDEYNNC